MSIEEQYDKLLKYCYMKTKNYHVAEDIVQETFLRFYKATRYKNSGKEMAYLYTIARNLCNDYFKEKQTLEIDEERLYAYNDNKLQELESALEKLDAADKELLFMRYINNENINSIAKSLDISRFSVHRRIKKALEKLKEAYLNEQ